jgi:two-component system, probable response regulator PhcQ
MQPLYDYKRYAVLYVDDEEMALKYFERTFGNEFRILTAPNALEGLKILEAQGDEIGVLMTDQRMPGQKGVQLLERARAIKPKVVRMMITAYADFGVTVDAVNVGKIFRYVSKPLQVEDMRNTLRRAMEFFLLQKERDDLMREKLSVVQNMVIADRVVSLGVLASGLCQHLRNPLEAVRAFLNLTPTRTRGDAVNLEVMRDASFWRDFHNRVLKQSAQIAELIGEFEGVRLEQTVAAETEADVGEVAGKAVAAVRAAAEAKGVTVAVTAPDNLPKVRVDVKRLEHMLEMLLQNQLATLQPGQKLSIVLRPAPAAEGKAPGVELLVQDDGPGLPQDAVRAVFDPFCLEIEDRQDFGVRLLAAYFLAYHIGGQMDAETAEGKGATFRISLPAEPASAKPATTSSSDFIVKVLMNDVLWERLLAGD